MSSGPSVLAPASALFHSRFDLSTAAPSAFDTPFTMGIALVDGRRQRIRNDASVAQKLVIYPRLGNPLDDTSPPQGPGLILSGGGGHVGAAYRWAHQTLTGTPATRGGDVVILRATLDNGYSSAFMHLGHFNSAQTLAIPPNASPQELAQAAAIVSKAELVFFSGGQQSRYLTWRNSPLLDAVQHTYDRGGIVGGTSAGLALLGNCILSGQNASSQQLAASSVLQNPLPAVRDLVPGVFHFNALHTPFLAETHFHARNRYQRLASLLSHMGRGTRGIAVDERTALVVDKSGKAHVTRCSKGGGDVFLVQAQPSIHPNPIHTQVQCLRDPAETVDLNQPNPERFHTVTVDPQRPQNPYSRDPYR